MFNPQVNNLKSYFQLPPPTNFNYSDFEAESDPFERAELQTLDDLGILARFGANEILSNILIVFLIMFNCVFQSNNLMCEKFNYSVLQTTGQRIQGSTVSPSFVTAATSTTTTTQSGAAAIGTPIQQPGNFSTSCLINT